MGTHPLAVKKRDDHRIAALRPPVRTVAPRRGAGPRRPVVTLADVVRMPGHAEQDVPVDGATVQANHRIALPCCCQTLGWSPDTPLRFTVGDGEVLLTRADDQPELYVRVRHQITLSAPLRHALSVHPTDTVVAVADVHAGTIRLLGPAAIADAERFARQPRPVRDALNQLAPALTSRRLALVLRLLARIDDDQLAALVGLPDQLLDQLLAADEPATDLGR